MVISDITLKTRQFGQKIIVIHSTPSVISRKLVAYTTMKIFDYHVHKGIQYLISKLINQLLV